MSNFLKETKHPKTGEWEMAQWLDNYFGHHKYGVWFPSDKKVYDVRDAELETRERKTEKIGE